MKITVVTIKVLFWITLISVIITIPLSLCNVCCGIWFAQWGCAIAIGVFASSFVVLISEYIRYKHLKNEIESDIYFNLSLLYLKLKSTLSIIDKSYKEPIPRLTSSFLKPQTQEINNSNEKVKHDILLYCTLRENEMSKEAKSFALQTTPLLINIIFALRDVDVAINEDTIDVYKDNLESYKQYRGGQRDNYCEKQPHITSSSPHTNAVLQNVKSLMNDELFDSLESLLLAISNSKSNCFDWRKDKERVQDLV